MVKQSHVSFDFLNLKLFDYCFYFFQVKSSNVFNKNSAKFLRKKERSFNVQNTFVKRNVSVTSTKVDTHNTTNVDKSNETKSKVRNIPSYKTSRLFDKSFDSTQQIEPISVNSKFEELFSNVKFDQLNIHKLIVSCLHQRFTLSEATSVQALSIPPLLEGKDALIKSATGSGKTLAYSIPMIHYLQSIEPPIDRTHGLHALIILPTRELALQTYDCLNKLLQPFRRIVLGILVGGEKKKSEKARIRKGLNILVSTPGRLLDHLDHTKSLNFAQLKWLVIDEADRLYEQGFSAIIGQIIERIQNLCPNISQTVLLSATLSEGVKELAGLSLKNPAIIDVGTSEHRLETITLPTSLHSCFLVIPPKLRLVTLVCILIDAYKTNSSSDLSKIIVFMSCQDVVDFYCTLLNETLPKLVNETNPIKIFQLRGNISQIDRKEVFKKFHQAKCGILFCTDVASRGLDLPDVDLVIQMSIPTLVEDYVHRVGRTARAGAKGQSILFVLPSETQFVPYLQEQISVNMESLRTEDFFKSVNRLNFSDAELHTDQERIAHLQVSQFPIFPTKLNLILANFRENNLRRRNPTPISN